MLPPEAPKGGRPRIPDRDTLEGILYVLKTGTPWEHLPLELGYGSGMTCWRRLRDWHEAGVFTRLHQVLLDRMNEAEQPDWSRASLDSTTVPAARGGSQTGLNPTDRGRPDSERQVIVDGRGTPLAVLISPANHHDSMLFEPLPDAVPLVRNGRWGHPRKRPEKVYADKAYDIPRCRRACVQRRIKVRIARRGVESSERLGRKRWVVERTLSWFSRFRRLRGRYEVRAGIHLAFTQLACCLITFKQHARFC
nr:IS5 family transposase [Deinobacterium chartae]